MQAASIDDLRVQARRRMPRFVFDWLDGGAESEVGMRANRKAFDAIRLLPRYLEDTSEVSHQISLFGQTYDAPLGIAPMGFTNLAWPGADRMLARLAAARNIPIVASTAASSPLEQFAEDAEGRAWFQLYVGKGAELNQMFLNRAKAAGYKVLVVTVDVASPAKRDRDVRNGMRIPFQFTPKILADLALHPHWSLTTLKAGAPKFANLEGHGFDVDKPMSVKDQQDILITKRFDWEALARLRDDWPGQLIVKGVMRPETAVRVVETGCDGVIVSNHGGRQADFAPASLSVLPAISQAVGGRVPVMLDSGVRRGADIVRAKALGADMVFAGRPFAFGAAAAGPAGVDQAFDILHSEMAGCLGQIGIPRFAAVNEDAIWTG